MPATSASLRLVYLGTSEFSVPPLRALIEAGHRVLAVVTQPDRPGDRGRPAPRPVADAAVELGLPVLQPPRLRADEAQAEITALGADALVVAAYGQILPASLLDAHRLGGINVHASLLPRHRGASPIAAAILAGDATTGVAIMRMEAGLDTGPVYASISTPIGATETTPEVSARLATMGADLLVSTLAQLIAGTAKPVAQDEAAATHAPRLTRADGHVRWSEVDAVAVDRRVRALQPWPGVTASLAGEEVRILAGSAAPEAPSGAPGSVVQVEGTTALVATREGTFRVERVQPPGRRPMDAAAYLRGRRAPGRGSFSGVPSGRRR